MSDPVLVVDACLVITFGNEERLELVTNGSRRVIIGSRAAEEVKQPPASVQLESAIEEDAITVESIDLDESEEQEALARYDAMPAFRDRGDAEVIALAVTRGYVVGSDDQAIRRQVRRDLGPERIAGTLDLTVWAIREDRMTVSDAEAFLRACDVGPSILRALRVQGVELEDLA